jgi:hypothetical protein
MGTAGAGTTVIGRATEATVTLGCSRDVGAAAG